MLAIPSPSKVFKTNLGGFTLQDLLSCETPLDISYAFSVFIVGECRSIFENDLSFILPLLDKIIALRTPKVFVNCNEIV